MPDLFLGIDVGTSSLKALLLDARGGVAATASSAYDTASPKPGWSEQDPELWVAGLQDAMAKLGGTADLSRVACVGLTGQMHGLVALDASGQPLRPAILWNDQRTAAQVERAHALLHDSTFIARTGKPLMTGYTLPKILWMREHEPELCARLAHVLLPKDYVRFVLTGVRAIDVADASGVSLLNIRSRAWDEQLCGELGVPMEWLPPAYESPVVCARISASGAARFGLRPGTPVVAGAGDQAAEAVGTGTVRPGDVSVTIGTSGVVFATTEAPTIDSTGRVPSFCHASPGLWHVMGVMLSAGGSLAWLARTLDTQVEELIAKAERVPAGAEGLLFAPYLSGERCPHPDPSARGAFVGLTTRHHAGHLARAVIEGVCYGLRDCLDLIAEIALGPTSARLAGGASRSVLWRQTLADVLGVPVRTPAVSEGAAFGAAVLAGVGVGAWPSVPAACTAVVTLSEPTEPGSSSETLQDGHGRFAELYPALRQTFASLSVAVGSAEE